MLERLPARVRTPRVARAMTSPSGILLAGAGASAAILGGLPLAVAAGIAGAAWLARVALSVPRTPPEDRIDAEGLAEPWRTSVREAQSAAARYRRAVATSRPGPLRDRLVEIGGRIDDGVREAWRVARRGAALEGAVADLDVDAARRELADAVREADGPGAAPSAARTIDALRAQLASAGRIEAVAKDARDRLRLLDARLDEAVARAVELALQTDDTGADASGLGDDVDSVVGEMESLRAALEQTGPPRAGIAPS